MLQTSEITQDKKNFSHKKSTMVYVDYENIYHALQFYNKNVIEMDFVNKLNNFFLHENLHIIDMLFYANFDIDEFHSSFHQSFLQEAGVTTRHTSNYGKNSSDIYMVIDVLKDLLAREQDLDIDIFIIISADRDMIPLIRTITQYKKYAYLITTRNNLEGSILKYVNKFEYLENILDLNLCIAETMDTTRPAPLSEKDNKAIEKIMTLVLSSNIWRNYKRKGKAINFEEYKKHLTIASHLLPDEIDRLLNLAISAGWIELYNYKRGSMVIKGLKEGQKYDELINSLKHLIF